MKKVFLTYAVLTALAITSCKDKANSDEPSEAQTEATTDKTTTEETTTESVSQETAVPNFSDSDVQDYVDSYEAYMEEYREVVESKDMSAFSALATQGQELATKAQEVSGKVTGTDAEKLTSYMTAKANEMQELSKKIME